MITATFAPPTSAGVVFVTAVPGSVERVELGPTWTPLPTSTPLPSATPTATLPPLTTYEIIFAAADSPVGLRRIFASNADGSNLRPINIELNAPPLQVEVTAEATSEAIGTEEAIENTPLPAVYEELEFLEPAVSPDSAFLAFTAQLSPEVQEIFVMPLPDGAPRQLTTLGGSITGGAVWSPDGTRIA
ncbi:MAG: PD40 domain-containing protein, partial [Dehalococcoidia bacterium]|nr:PD40 domain-containing protein [Dehalococcoidia bacterium]